MIPSDRRFAVAFVPGLGGVVLTPFGDGFATWHVSDKLGEPKNRAAYRAACALAAAKLA